jgi:preprotein translocase subunit SecA
VRYLLSGRRHAERLEALAARFVIAAPQGAPPPHLRDGRKVGRNEPCPCGSGKKYKHCHGQLAREE